ncbi:MAG: 16S rRNA (cytosine1402-N4)-methyltransferase [Anaerolineaceae bacterium]|nr:MAG: 16S rRNA (cytosine1402-N4)-methyltransferase [Anaerolineaceae bacterium]
MDGTLGAGGHASGILEASAPDGKLLGLDVDPQALELARRTLAPFGERACLMQASYTALPRCLSSLGWETVDGILLDLGASSMQFDTPGRGFSFLQDGPLDMRFDPLNPLTAAQIVNEWPEDELANVIHRYGEEPAARRIARVIVRSRPVGGTRALAAVIEQALGRRRSPGSSTGRRSPGSSTGRGPRHPATQAFQALRIAVNGELEAVEETLPLAVQALGPGGRLAVISFHSLEDRLVKETFRRESRDCLCPTKQPVCTCGHKASIIEINRRPVTPSEEETSQNPRARSAKLRIAERLPVHHE